MTPEAATARMRQCATATEIERLTSSNDNRDRIG